MSSQLAAEYYKTPDEYLAAERVSEHKHEYLAGIVYAMAGASARHNRIVENILRNLGNQLSEGPCEAFSSDLKVRIRKSGAEFYYYPDVIVDCSSIPDTSYYAEEPRVIFEVLSPDTERIDRGEKLNNYQTLESLRIYLLVDQARIAITVYRRSGDTWDKEFFSAPEHHVPLPEIECGLPLSSIYARTDLLA